MLGGTYMFNNLKRLFCIAVIFCILSNNVDLIYASEENNNMLLTEEEIFFEESKDTSDTQIDTEMNTSKQNTKESFSVEISNDDMTNEEESILTETDDIEIDTYATGGTVSASKISQTIPKSASQDLVNKGIILYKIGVSIMVRYTNGRPVANRAISFGVPSKTNIKSIKILTSETSTSTDSSGSAKVYFEVRGHGEFTLQTSCDGIRNNSTIKVVESCYYQSPFYITAYVIALESDYNDVKVTANGIPNYKFREKFLDAVKLNGSGHSTDNNFYIRYNKTKNQFEKGNPITSSGTKPTVNRTIAVDNYYIPRYNTDKQYGCVNIYNVGNFKAEDAGGAIKRYHIDIFVGEGNNAWKSYPHQDTNKTVKYLGNNKNI